MVSQVDLQSLRKAGAVGDTTGTFFDRNGEPVDHPLNLRTLGVGFDALRRSNTVVMSAGPEKIDAVHAMLRGGVAKCLIIDGDSAVKLAGRL